MIKYILSAALLCVTLSYGSFEAVNINPNSVRIGNIAGFKKGDVLVPYLTGSARAVSAAYFVPFELSELSMQQVSYTGSLGKTLFMLAGKTFGNEDYRETSAVVSVMAYSKEGLGIFPSIKYYGLKNVLGSKTSFGADLNAFYDITGNFRSVVSILNIYAHETDNIDIPMTMLVSFGYRTAENFNIFTGVEKDSTNPAIFKTGIEYEPFDYFSVSAGYNFDPQLITSGFSIEYSGLNFSYGMSYHFDLAYSHSFGLVYEF
ncbi:MAG: hypothetical protein JXN63_08140 [Candidatus Delongbacteria bacterium]|nr:hypothetical protein [Candidatus Delongbacteria bacterium]